MFSLAIRPSTVRALVALAAAIGISACQRADARRAPDELGVSAITSLMPPATLASAPHADLATPGTVIDSALSIPEHYRRFIQGLTRPAGLTGGASTRDALVRRFARAVEAHDTTALRAMLLTREEFAYFYYPSSEFTSRPYEQPPALLWFQFRKGSERGIVRVLRRYGGHALGVSSYTCTEAPEMRGGSTYWNDCIVRRTPPGESERTQRLFGSIVERGGQFKFVSYTNDL